VLFAANLSDIALILICDKSESAGKSSKVSTLNKRLKPNSITLAGSEMVRTRWRNGIWLLDCNDPSQFTVVARTFLTDQVYFISISCKERKRSRSYPSTRDRGPVLRRRSSLRGGFSAVQNLRFLNKETHNGSLVVRIGLRTRLAVSQAIYRRRPINLRDCRSGCSQH